MTLKICTRCKQALPLAEFYRKTPKKLFGPCKACVRAREKDYRLHRASPEILARRRAYRRPYTAESKATYRAYRERKKAAPGSHTKAEWTALCDWFGNACLCCGSVDRLTKDHVIPFIKGGSDRIDNLQLLCFSCNSSKQANDTDYRDPERLAAFLESLK